MSSFCYRSSSFIPVLQLYVLIPVLLIPVLSSFLYFFSRVGLNCLFVLLVIILDTLTGLLIYNRYTSMYMYLCALCTCTRTWMLYVHVLMCIMYMYTYMYVICTCTCMLYVHVHLYMHVICTCTYIHVLYIMCTHQYVCFHVLAYIYMYLYTCTYTCMYICTYTHVLGVHQNSKQFSIADGS